MVTGGQREAITDVIFSILTNTQTAAGAMMGAGADAYQKQQASGQTAGGIISQAKQKLLQNALVRYPKELVQETQKMSKSLLGRLGIQFSIASILKQSQIFTGVLGSVFQILGAMVDVFLAPLMPFFIRTLRGMVNLIPYVQEKGEQFAAWIENLALTSTSFGEFISKVVDDAAKSIVVALGKGALATAKGYGEQLINNPAIQDATILGAAGLTAAGPKGGIAGFVTGYLLNVLGFSRPLENQFFDDALRGGQPANREQAKKTNDIAYQGNFNTYFETQIATTESWDQ